MDAKETTLYQAVLIAAVVIGGVIMFLVLSFIRQHRRHLQTYRSKIRTEIAAMESERTRIASDLHDDIGPLLSALKFKTSGIRSADPEEQALISQVNDHADEIITRMRNISNALMPGVLMRKGLLAAVESFMEWIAANNSLRVKFIPGELPPLRQDSSVHLYRIIQEVIHNTIKHAKAQRLVIRLYCSNGDLILLTRDDGIGFDYYKIAAANKGLGLHNIESRTDILKGSFSISSAPGKGTQLYIRIPIRQHTLPA